MRVDSRYWIFCLCYVVLMGGVTGCEGVTQTLPTVMATAVLPTFPPPVLITSTAPPTTPATETAVSIPLPSPTAEPVGPTPTPVLQPTPLLFSQPVSQTIGYSVQERPISAYQFGSGPEVFVFVGGIHGGYEWNTILLAYETIDYLQVHPEAIPADKTVYIIPSANPDGQFTVTLQNGRFDTSTLAADTIPGRFNANGVDLNRNWDCNWAATGVWREQTVSGGERPFSEPENQFLRDFLLMQKPKLVVFWHSAADGVFAAGCPGTDPTSLQWATLYGQAASYPIYEQFTSYSITGDAGDWLTTQGIPSFTVELTTHADTDWPQNLAGLLAVLGS